MFEGIKAEFQCLERQDKNYNLEGQDQNDNVSEDKVRILMFRRTRSEFQCLEGLGQNSNVWKDRAKIPEFERIREDTGEFQCMEG